MAFHHLPEPGNVLAILGKLLVPDGVAAILDLQTEDGSFHAENPNSGAKHNGFSEDDFRRWAKTANLRYTGAHPVHTITRDSGSYPVLLATFQK
jgi:hypothetical protein